MSDFMQKNKALVGVLGFTSVVAVVMIALVAMKYQAIGAKIDEIDDIGKEIDSITSATKPRIVTENARLINEDAKALEAKTKTLQRVFGGIYDPAFDAFLKEFKAETSNEAFNKAVADVTRATMAKTLADIIKDEDAAVVFYPTVAMKEKLFAEMKNAAVKAPRGLSDEEAERFAAVAAERFDAAYSIFCSELAKIALEKVDAKNVAAKAMFLQVLGLPRSFEDTLSFTTYLTDYAQQLVQSKAIPFEREIQNNKNHVMEILLDREVKKDAASQDVKLALDNIPYIVTRCQIYENLFTNMKNAGVKYIALKRKGSDKPEPVKVEGREVAFSAYPYEMVVRGTLPQIRDFANKLHQEYQNNRVYVVDSFVLSTDSGESAEADPTKRSVEVANSIRIIEELKKSEEIKAKAMEAAAAAAANADDNADRQNAELAQEARKAAVRLEKNYGAATVGANNQVFATFHINYIVFIGDQLDNNKKARERR